MSMNLFIDTLRSANSALVSQLNFEAADPAVNPLVVSLAVTSEATLKAQATLTLTAGVVIRVNIGTQAYHMVLTSGTDAESWPDVVRPNDYNVSTNAKVWKLLPIGQTALDYYARKISLWTGSGTSKLAGVPTVLMPANTLLRVHIGNQFWQYKLTVANDAESVPDVIRPNDYDGSTNVKVWKLIPGTETQAEYLGATITALTGAGSDKLANVSAAYMRVGATVFLEL